MYEAMCDTCTHTAVPPASLPEDTVHLRRPIILFSYFLLNIIFAVTTIDD